MSVKGWGRVWLRQREVLRLALGLALSHSRCCPASASVQPRYQEQSSFLLSFLFPEVSRVSGEDGSAIKQLAVKVTERPSASLSPPSSLNFPSSRLTLFWNSMGWGRTFWPFHPSISGVRPSSSESVLPQNTIIDSFSWLANSKSRITFPNRFECFTPIRTGK